MSQNRVEVAVGAGVLALAFSFIFYAASLTGSGGGGSDTYELTASFSSAEGISNGTDVRMSGVKVGTVTDMDLNLETFRAEVELTLSNDIALPDDTAVIISSEGLLGGSFVELLPGGSPFNLADGDVISDTQGAVSLINLLLKFVGGGGA